MAEITGKELTAISDLLSIEQTLVAKYNQFAQDTRDANLREQYLQISKMHQGHYDKLYSNLK